MFPHIGTEGCLRVRWQMTQKNGKRLVDRGIVGKLKNSGYSESAKTYPQSAHNKKANI